MSPPPPLTRDGRVPNRGGRVAVSSTLGRLLADGHRLANPNELIEAEEVRGWAQRIRELALDLADCIEAPVRNRVMELLSSPSLPDAECALTVLRLNIAGASARQLGAQCGVAANTIDRVETGLSCQARVAKQLADRFALGVFELFDHDAEGLKVRSVSGLRDAMTTESDLAVARL